ncbi:hypothetical protein [Streptomyces sp. NPDC048385]|uniref:hypothetical protein n=1 Tax=Streptomyces sp. NPDC048385 TaxID=3155145 RepID=UPI00342FCE70
MNEEQQNQLLQKIDERIAERLTEQANQIDKRFDAVDKRLDQQDDQFARLFTHMNDRMNSLEEKLDTKADKADIEKIMTPLDGIVKRLDDNEAEHAAVTSQVDRHETLLQRLAKQLGLN